MDELEIWLPVVGYEKFYSISNLGRLRGEPRLVVRRTGNNYWTKQRILRPGAGVKSGYLTSSLTKKNKVKTHYIHHLVLKAFVGPKPRRKEACHGDRDRKNNRVDNLRWDTRKSNHADKRIHGTGTVGEKHPKAKLTDKSVVALRKRRAEGITFKVLASEFGVTVMTAHRAVTGQNWSHIK